MAIAWRGWCRSNKRCGSPVEHGGDTRGDRFPVVLGDMRANARAFRGMMDFSGGRFAKVQRAVCGGIGSDRLRAGA